METKKIISYISLFCIVFFGLILIDSTPRQTSELTGHIEQVALATTTTTTSKNNTVATTTKAKIVPCDVNNGNFTCYQNFYTELTKQKGVDTAFKQLKKDYDANGYVRSQCHPFSHVIGHAAVSLYPEVAEAFKHGDPFCWSGYYHGVMEEVVERAGVSKITNDLDGICALVEGKASYSFDYYNCVHGLGHGLMSITDNELFKSLKYCDNLSGSWEKTSCYGGVFMENIMIDNRGLITNFLKPSQPLYPCNAVEEKYKSSCYLMQTSYMLKVASYDFSKVFAQCRQADKDYVGICFQSLGRDASGQSLSNAVQTKAKCDVGANYNEKSNCIIGAVKDFVSYYHSDVQAKSFCESLDLDLQDICLNTANSYYRSF